VCGFALSALSALCAFCVHLGPLFALFPSAVRALKAHSKPSESDEMRPKTSPSPARTVSSGLAQLCNRTFVFLRQKFAIAFCFLLFAFRFLLSVRLSLAPSPQLALSWNHFAHSFTLFHLLARKMFQTFQTFLTLRTLLAFSFAFRPETVWRNWKTVRVDTFGQCFAHFPCASSARLQVATFAQKSSTFTCPK